MKIMSYVFWQISSSIKLRLGKITTGKKGTVLVFLASVLKCHHISYFENENYELCFLAGFFVDEIMTGNNYDRKNGTMLVFLVLWGNSFWYYWCTIQ